MIKVVSGNQYNDLEMAMELVNIYGINMDYSSDTSADDNQDRLMDTMDALQANAGISLSECNNSCVINPLDPKYVESSGRLKPVKGLFKKLVRKGIGWYLIQLFNDQNVFNSAVVRVQNEHNEEITKAIDEIKTIGRKKAKKKKAYILPDDFYCKLEKELKPELAELKKRNKQYTDLLKDKKYIIDCGCGDGMLLQDLHYAGHRYCYGVDKNLKMVRNARKKGLKAICSDANTYLSRLRDDCLDAIVSAHMVEYLNKDDLYGFMKLSSEKLKTGGILIIETFNPLSLGVLSHELYNMSRHINLIHPVMLKYLAEYTGFEVDQITMTGSFSEDCLFDENVQDSVEKKNIHKLNNQLYGALNYTLICHKL